MSQESINSLSQILPKREKRSLGTMQVYPENVTFNSQDPGESIYILTRSHVAINIGWIIRFIMALFFPIVVIVIYSLFNSFLVTQNIEPLPLGSLFAISDWVMIIIFYFSLCTSYALINFLDWYFDIYLVTNLRILHVDFAVFSGKSVSEATLANIQDVSQNVVGFLPSFFAYGDVLVQTAAEKTRFYFKALPDPDWFRDVLTDLSTLARARSKKRSSVPVTPTVTWEMPTPQRVGGEP